MEALVTVTERGNPDGSRLRHIKKFYRESEHYSGPVSAGEGIRGVENARPGNVREWGHSGAQRAELGEGHVIQFVSAPGRRARRVGQNFDVGTPPIN